MSARSPRPCSRAGCHTLTTSRYCEAHTRQHAKAESWRTTKGSASSRGYGAVWRRLRTMVLARDPFCMVCTNEPSVTVDHIKPLASGGDNSFENLRGICERCHKRKTAKDGHTAKAMKRLANTMRRQR